MNHDENNLNPNREAWSDPELEARIVAWVAGEASAFEAAELERLTAAKPEVAAFKCRIEEVHGLVAEAARPERESLRLSAERRAKLLAVLGATAASEQNSDTGVKPTSPAPVVLRSLPAQRREAWKRTWMIGTGIAASMAIGVFVLTRVGSPFSGARIDSVKARETDRAILAWVKAKDEPAQVSYSPGISPASREVPVNFPANVQFAPPSAPVPDDERRVLRGAAVDAVAAANKPLVFKSGAGASTFGSQAQSSAPTVKKTDESAALTFGTPPGGIVLGASAVDQPLASSQAGGRAFVQVSGDVTVRDAKQSIATGGLALSTLQEPPGFSFSAAPEAAKARSLQSSNAAVATQPSSSFNVGQLTVGGTVDADRAALAIANPIAPALASPAPKDAGYAVALQEMASAAAPAVKLEAGPARADADNVIQLQAFEVRAPSTAMGAGQAVAGNERPRSVSDAFVGAKPTEGKVAAKEKARLVARLEEEAAVTPPAAQTIAPVPSAPAPADAETSAAQEPNSTFSLHVSDVSFRLAQATLAAMERGENPSAPEIRPEEFYNAFDYGDPTPTTGEKVACYIEQAAHPVLQQRNLVRIAMKVAATGRIASQPLRLTVLLDTSGSMERQDRAAAVRRAMETLISLLGPNDRLTLIGFARQPRLLVENLPGDQARNALDLLARTPAEGGTNIEEALKLGSELARRHHTAGAQSRIVVLTDGAANLGDAEPERLRASVESLRQQGIAFDACGVGLEGVGDAILEALTRKGNGRYYVLNSAEAADASFARQLAGAFRPAAENVKLQVRFNPARVGHYRLIGFEQHRLKTEDFRNDQVDAAELAAEEAAVALYQIEVLPQGAGEIGEVYVRFRDAATGEMVEHSWPIAYDGGARAFDRATPSLQLAGVASLLAEKFRETPLASQFKLGDFAAVVNGLRSQYAAEPRVQELVTMFAQVRKFTGE